MRHGRRQMVWLAGIGLLAVLMSVTGGAQAPVGTFRLATFDANGDPRLGATVGNGENDLLDVHNGIRYLLQTNAPEARNLPYIPMDMRTLAGTGTRATGAIRQIYQLLAARKAAGTLKDPGGQYRVFYAPTAVKFLPPVPNPSKIYGFAGNYPREGDLANPKFPSSFFKSVASLTGHDDPIDLAGLITRGVHEPELSLVLSRAGKNIPEAQALDYIFGFMICNDVSSRDLQQGSHPTQGATFDKGLDTFSPCGPYLTLKEDVPNAQNLAISATINGQPSPMPNSNTRFMTFKIPQIISYVSGRMRLEVGDIFQTGVPAPVVPLKAGDTVEIAIEGLGTPLRNRVVANGATAGVRQAEAGCTPLLHRGLDRGLERPPEVVGIGRGVLRQQHEHSAGRRIVPEDGAGRAVPAVLTPVGRRTQCLRLHDDVDVAEPPAHHAVATLREHLGRQAVRHHRLHRLGLQQPDTIQFAAVEQQLAEPQEVRTCRQQADRPLHQRGLLREGQRFDLDRLQPSAVGRRIHGRKARTLRGRRVEAGVRHPERTEDALFEEQLERLPRPDLDEPAEDCRRFAVAIARSRILQQRHRHDVPHELRQADRAGSHVRIAIER